MRLPVVVSVVFHVALVAAAVRLPMPPSASKAPIVVDIQSRPLTPPPPVAPEPALPRPRPAVAMRTAPVGREREREREPVRAPEPPPLTARPNEPPPQALDSMPRRSGTLDLSLHGLPAGPAGSDGIVVAPGGTGGGTFGTSTGTGTGRRGGWHPRGDAGDPILGKIAEKNDPYPLKSLGRDGFLYEGPSFNAHVDIDGEVHFDDKNFRDFKGLSGGFDITDLMMKGKGEDPQRHEKKKFLEATADMRAKLAATARAERVRDSLYGLPGHLEEVWSDGTRSPRARRRSIFLLWKEASGTDEELAAAGGEARTIIEAFIRRRLPQGSPEAYTPEELLAYNRSGRLRFDPYR